MPDTTKDVTVSNGGNIFLFELHTPAAHGWTTDNISLEAWQWNGPDSFCVETRYARDLAAGMIASGLEVE